MPPTIPIRVRAVLADQANLSDHQSMTTQRDKAKRWRPWQFSLWTLIILTLVVAAFFAGWQEARVNAQADWRQ